MKERWTEEQVEMRELLLTKLWKDNPGSNFWGDQIGSSLLILECEYLIENCTYEPKLWNT